MTKDDAEWIEKFYNDFEAGYRALGRTYVRPVDYIERALRVLYGSNRKKLGAQYEGKKGYFHED